MTEGRNRHRQSGDLVHAVRKAAAGDYNHLGLTLRQHPVSFLREDLARRRVMTCADAAAMPDGRSVRVAGLVLVRQKPGSANGVLCVTLEVPGVSTASMVAWISLLVGHTSFR